MVVVNDGFQIHCAEFIRRDISNCVNFASNQPSPYKVEGWKVYLSFIPVCAPISFVCVFALLSIIVANFGVGLGPYFFVFRLCMLAVVLVSFVPTRIFSNQSQLWAGLVLCKPYTQPPL